MSFEKINFEQQLSAVEKNKTTAVTAVPDKQIDYLIKEHSDLTSSGKSMDAFYAKWIRSNGADKFVELASRARQEGKVPCKYFSWLLKNHA